MSQQRPRPGGGESVEQALARRRARREAERRRRRQFRRRRIVLLLGVAAFAAGSFAIVSTARRGGSGSQARRVSAHGAGESGKRVGPPVNGQPQAPSQKPLPILMYHVIADPSSDSPSSGLFVRPDDFKAEMAWMADNGYSAVTLDQVDRAWFHGGTLPRKPIVISMDDGYRGQYVYALPTLKKLGWPADLNLLVDTLASGGELDDKQVKAMIDAGWEIDAHTVDHLDVSKLDGDDLAYEVAGSRRILRKRFEVPVHFFCYPAGQYDDEAIRAVKRAGYKGATTENAGLASKDQMYTLNRIRIELDDGVTGLEAKLAHPAPFKGATQ